MKNTLINQGNDRILTGFILAVLTFWLFANSMMNIGPIMSKELGVAANTINIAVSLAALFAGIFIVVLGGLADSIGRAKILRLGLYLSVVGSLFIALIPSGKFAEPLLLTGRALQGLSAACIMPTSLGLLKILWEGSAQQRAISFWSMGTFGGSGLSALFAGIVATNLGWRWIFVFSVIVAVIALYLLKNLPESKKESSGKYRPDWAGILIFLVSMICLELFITKGATFGWLSVTSILLILGAMITFIIFYYYEKRSSNHFFDLSLFKNKVFSGAIICNFLMNAAAGIVIVALTLMQTAANYSAQKAGLLTLGYAVSVILFIRTGERLMRKIGARKPMVWGSLIVALATILLMQTHVMVGTYRILALVAFTLFGTGLAFFATPATTAALSNLPAEQSGAGAGIFKMASSLGAGFGIAISAGIFTAVSKSTDALEWFPNIFSGRQDNINFRLAAILALTSVLLFALLSAVVAGFKIPKDGGKIINK
ncbi:MFS transporter [Chryseobacterium gotjawalense]|uniref:MFS transporter n=1 Tax=Chryseobacterium gotjawalense TaxID=3042315 RepID=A0ABY8RHP9_9FLAO|nr:MFS transporter [Chryseobacterium sp. wdc7]WHF52808.1 MFS transporter [Chryseobacterium sp. wdc7]